jgi:glycosyltransferase involved in cell wall biosynthesis
MEVRLPLAASPSLERIVKPSADVLRTANGTAAMVVHAVAQLPDTVSVELSVDDLLRRRLQLIAKAYGIEQRVRFQREQHEGSALDELGTLVDDLLCDGKHLGEIVEALTLPDDPAVSLRKDDSLLRGQRIAIVTNLPTHYRLPLFSRMSKRLKAVDARFRVFFLARESQTRPWLTAAADADFEYEYMRSFSPPIGERPPSVPLDLEYRLARFGPTLVLAAGFSPLVSSRVARIARIKRAAFGIWSGETTSQASNRSRLRHRHRSALVGRADFAVTYGFDSASYLHGLRPDLPLVLGRNTSSVVVSEGSGLELPRSGDVDVLVIGDLANHRKGVDIAIDAVKSSPALNCRLTVIGGGKALPELSRAAGADSRIRFLGSQSPAEVGRALGSSEIVLFPTRADIFGLVLVEAMGAGAATVTSTAAGATADLAVDGVNCLVAGDYEPRTWADCLSRLLADPELRQRLGTNARATIARRWTIDHAADAMLAGLRLGILARRNGSVS